MEKVEFKNIRSKNLVGNFYMANNDSGIIMLHGFTGDKSEHGRFDRIAKALHEIGYNVLAFDFSGCGESDDDTLTLEKQINDYYSALRWFKAKGISRIGVFGLSLGGLVALRGYTPEILTLVLTAPVTDKVRYNWEESYTQKQLMELNEKGYITIKKQQGTRETILVDKQMLKDRESVNQRMLCKHVQSPVLIIHGDEDDMVPYGDSKQALSLLPNGSKLETIHGAGHDFARKHLESVIILTKNWFSQHL